MSEIETNHEHQTLSQKHLIDSIHEAIRKELVFTAGGFYCDYLENPEYHGDERIGANCGPFAALSADLISQQDDYMPYIFIVNSHTGALAVNQSHVALLNSDTPGVSRPNVEESAFLDSTVYDSMRNGVEYIYVKHARPDALIKKGIEPLYQAWAYATLSSVAILRWPEPGDSYLLLHSRMRKLIKGVLLADNFAAANINLALDIANQLRPIDLTIDDSIHTYQSKSFYYPKKMQHILVSYPGNEKRMAIERYAKLAKTEADLQKVIELAGVLYRPQGLIEMNSDLQSHKSEQIYKWLAHQARHLGYTALSREIMH
jgi:hypothetical protein